jgi:hypothetical protein
MGFSVDGGDEMRSRAALLRTSPKLRDPYASDVPSVIAKA